MAQRFSATWLSQQITPIIGAEEAQLAISVFKGMMGQLYSNVIFRELLPVQTCFGFTLLFASVLESIRLYEKGIDTADPGSGVHAAKVREQIDQMLQVLSKPPAEEEEKPTKEDEADLDRQIDALLNNL